LQKANGTVDIQVSFQQNSFKLPEIQFIGHTSHKQTIKRMDFVTEGISKASKLAAKLVKIITIDVANSPCCMHMYTSCVVTGANLLRESIRKYSTFAEMFTADAQYVLLTRRAYTIHD